jgi:hypothetical protein
MPSDGEYLSSNSMTAYPFMEDAGVPDRVCRLFCDAVVPVSYGRSFSARLTGIDVSDESISFSISSEGEDHGFSLNLSECRGSYHVARDGRLSVVVDMDHARDSERFSDDGPYPLSPSCADFDPRAVTSISLMRRTDGDPVSTYEGKIDGLVRLVSGTNARIVASESGMEINAEPGAGKGRVPCDCPEPESDSSVPFLVPESTGDIVLDGDGCIQVNTDNVSTITISGRCTACCPTSKYQDQLNRLKELMDVVKSTYSTSVELAGKYNRYATFFNEFLDEPIDDELVVSVPAFAPVPRERSDEWSNMRVLGSHNKAMVSTNVANLSQKDVSVELYPPVCQGMRCIMSSVSLGAATGASLGRRRIRNAKSPITLDLKSGESVNVYSVMKGIGNVPYMEDGSRDVSQSATFVWMGKEIIDDRVVVVQRSLSKSAEASFTVARDQE